jgi:CheY-like chemotaxis protein
MPEGTRLSSGASHVLVVSKSPISRIVVSGIVERAGLKAVPEMPALAPARLGGLDPELVIVDVEGDCDDLLLALRDYRRASPANLPRVILLSLSTAQTEMLKAAHVVDAVVTKPITPETLQPVIDRLVFGHRA